MLYFNYEIFIDRKGGWYGLTVLALILMSAVYFLFCFWVGRLLDRLYWWQARRTYRRYARQHEVEAAGPLALQKVRVSGRDRQKINQRLKNL
jgi:hypothetical protein